MRARTNDGWARLLRDAQPTAAALPRQRRVLVVDRSRLAAEALMFALDSDPDIEAIGYALDRSEAIELVRAYTPDVVIVGASTGELEEPRFVAWLREQLPQVVSILICDHEHDTGTEPAGCNAAVRRLDASCSADELLYTVTRAPAGPARATVRGRGAHLQLVRTRSEDA